MLGMHGTVVANYVVDCSDLVLAVGVRCLHEVACRCLGCTAQWWPTMQWTAQTCCWPSACAAHMRLHADAGHARHSGGQLRSGLLRPAAGMRCLHEDCVQMLGMHGTVVASDAVDCSDLLLAIVLLT